MGRTYGLLILFLVCCHTATAQVKFVVESLPETTPANDSIFISGTFNNWVTNDPKYMLIKQPNGQLAITLSFEDPTLEYKFTRGDWLKVETGGKNGYIPNRVFHYSSQPEEISIRIQNWQDLGGARRFEYLTFYFFTAAILALFLVFLSMRIFKKEPERRKVFVVIHLALVMTFLGAVIYYVVNPIWQTHVIMLSQVLVFVWGYLYYIFLKVIGFGKSNPVRLWYVIPVSLASIFVLLRWLNLDSLAFFSSIIQGNPAHVNLIMYGTGAILFAFFLLKFLFEEKKNLLTSTGLQRVFVFAFPVIHVLCLLLLLQGIIQDYLGIQFMALNGYKLFLVSLSLVLFLEGLVIWKDPHFFRNKPHNIRMDEAGELLGKLKVIMEQEEAFRHPELTVQKLAAMMDTKPHILSKLLNEHFGQNFRDFVNTFRVEQFIHQANEGRLESLTYLGLAHEVGFNSKSTFNLAFKKITGQNPRDYFKAFAT